jgi:ABC-type nitrate/sulfonate/bicarbonate transport system substrate-binding protein
MAHHVSRLFAVVLALCAGTIAPAIAQNAPAIVKTAINPAIYSNLPVLIAIEKGYFAAEGIDLKVTRYSGSSVTQMPVLARGDLNIALVAAGPGLFNQRSEGFDIKLIASVSQPSPGWHDTSWLIVRKDLWESGAIRSLKDIKGHSIDGGTQGGANSFLVQQALVTAGLTRNDVKYSARIRAADGFAALTNKAIDVLGALEPTVAELIEQGLAVRLASTKDIMPWFQEAYLGAPADWVAKNPATVVAFLKAYLRGARDITNYGPHWNPEYAQILSNWSKIPVETIMKTPSSTFFGQYGAIRMESLTRQQDFWASEGLVKEKVDPSTLLDTRYLDQARKELNIQ